MKLIYLKHCNFNKTELLFYYYFDPIIPYIYLYICYTCSAPLHYPPFREPLIEVKASVFVLMIWWHHTPLLPVTVRRTRPSQLSPSAAVVTWHVYRPASTHVTSGRRRWCDCGSTSKLLVLLRRMRPETPEETKSLICRVENGKRNLDWVWCQWIQQINDVWTSVLSTNWGVNEWRVSYLVPCDLSGLNIWTVVVSQTL